MKLHRKGIPVDTRCPLCYRLDEDGGHCFVKCKKVKQVWRMHQLEHVRLQLVSCVDALNFLEEIFKLQKDIKLKTFLLLWRWWHERNSANKGNVLKSFSEICSSIDYHFLNVVKAHEGRTLARQQKLKWSRPPAGILKINTYGAFHGNTNDGGWGFVIRNDCGMVIAAGAGNLGQVSNALHSEAMAMLHAINAAIQMGCHCVIMETDSV